MRVHVDVEQLRATAGPLRQAVKVADELPAVQAELRAGAVHLGDAGLTQSVEGFLEAWSGGLAATARRGDALAKMLEVAAGGYHETEQDVRSKTEKEGDS